jgi:hypothetical protein
MPERIIAVVAYRVLLGGALLGAIACGDSAKPCADGPYDCAHAHDLEPSLEMGTGDPDGPDFVPLPEDGRLPLHAGPQGGYHVFLQARTQGLCANRVNFLREIREPGGDELVRPSQTAPIRMIEGGEAGTWVFPRAQVSFVCPPTLEGVAVADRELEIEVTVEEDPKCAGGPEPRAVSATLSIVPTCPEDDETCARSTDVGCAAR